MESLLHRHGETLAEAIHAMQLRAFWSPYPESPSRAAYGETAREDGLAAFTALLGADFTLPGTPLPHWIDGEQSPYGIELGIRYPGVAPQAAVTAAAAALPAWRDAGPDVRTGICLEILHRLNARSFELAHAGMHTTGQPFVMAFQATGPHAQDRGLEAVAHAYAAMTRHASTATWDKRTARHHISIEKEFHAVPRGVAVVLCCSTFPTWNSYPGLFASLVTGNPVIVKPHPRAVLPLALTVRVGQEVLIEQGLSPELLSLVVDGPGVRHAARLATAPEVRIVDFTGSGAFGEWLEANARKARVYAEKSGINSIVIDSTDDVEGMCRNIAHSLALYSGQMCTAPQAIFVPGTGVPSDRGLLSHHEIAGAIVAAVDELMDQPSGALNVLGAIGDPAVIQRIADTASRGTVLRHSETLSHPEFPAARQRTPLIMAVGADETDAYGVERFGPISFVVQTAHTAQSLSLVRKIGLARGALTTSLYSTSEEVVARARGVALEVGITMSVNLTDELFMNQSAAFSDFHGTGNNPAANATLVDEGFVSDRFTVVEVRRPTRTVAREQGVS
jgi:phenylacetic acid degradation protein paaN